MVVEELIAKLGFKVEGADQIKKFDKALENAKKSVEDFGKSANKALAGNSTTNNQLKGMTAGMGQATTAGDKFRAFVDRLRAGATTTAVSMARFGMSVASVLSRIAGGAAIVGTMAVALFKMAAAAALAASKAAILRREQQMAARGNRTTAANVDKVSAGLQGFGFDKDKAGDVISSIYDASNKAIIEDGGKAFAKKNSVSVLDARGNQRDPAAMFFDFAKVALDRRNAAEAAKAASDKLAPGNKGYKAALNKKNKLEFEARKYLDDLGVDGIAGIINQLPAGTTFADFARVTKERNALKPPPNADQEARSARIADNASKLQTILEGLQQPFTDLRETIVDKVLPPLIAFGTFLTNLGKRLGVINETEAEKYDRQVKEEKARREREPFDTRGNFLQNTLGAQALRKLFGFPEPAEPYGPAYDPAGPPMPATPIQNAPLPPRRAAAPDLGAFKPSTEDVISGLAAFAGALRATTTEVQSRNGPAAVAKDTQAKIENDQRKYENIGNDQRTISVNTTVNQTVTGASAPAAAGAAVSSAASAATQKASNASTAAATSP